MTDQDPSKKEGVDEQTFRRFKEGCQEAATRVVRIHYPRLVAYLRLMTGSLETAEEVAQEAFLKAYQERAKLLRPESILPWLMLTARRMALREMSRKRHATEFAMDPQMLSFLGESVEANQSRGVRSEELAGGLERAINRLSPGDRELIVLRYFSELQIKEIADTLEMPMGSVGVKLRRALDRLRRHLEEEGIGFEDLA